MAKARPSGRLQGRRAQAKTVLNGTQVPRSKACKSQAVLSPTDLLAQSTNLLQTGQPDAALSPARRALELLQNPHQPNKAPLPALTLLGEIYLELGDPASATDVFLKTVELDPDGTILEDEGGGAEKFFWLAQLCEEGGEESIGWFEKGVEVLERDVAALEPLAVESLKDEAITAKVKLEEKKRKLAAALCGMVEVWMTDLSLHPDAESTCTSLMTRALAASSNPSNLQTHASLLISQSDIPSARDSLTRSLALWQHLPPDHPDVPDFSTRISLSRLLMEAAMETEAMGVLEELVLCDDESVEGWYLGGWCALLMAGRGREKETGDDDAMEDAKEESRPEGEKKSLLVTGREWLRNSLRRYEIQEYEDDRLRDHARELVEDLDKELGETGEDEDGEGDEGWEDEDGGSEDGEKEFNGVGSADEEDEDEEMNGT
ncbi:hypothetical protein MMC30_005582 [Trapelia coarctata]|nr:hypothetical protein [Trapelia coarctata]